MSTYSNLTKLNERDYKGDGRWFDLDSDFDSVNPHVDLVGLPKEVRDELVRHCNSTDW